MPDAVGRLDEGAPDIVVADNAELERDAAFLRVPHRGRHARIGHRHDQVRGHAGFAGEFRPDRFARRIDGGPLDHGIGTGEVDVLEDAEPLALAPERLDAAHALLIDDDDLAGLHVAHELGADDVERAGLRRQHPAGKRVGADPPQDQRAHAQRIAHADQRLVRERHQRVGADDLLERVDQPVRHGRVQADRDEVDEHLGIGGGLEQAAAPHQGAAQDMRVGEVAVMRDREAAELEIRVERLHVAQDRLAGRGVAVVADCMGTRQGGDHPGVAEIIAHQPHTLVRVKAPAIEADDAGRLLPAMLQRVQAKRRHGGGIGHVPDAEHAALLVQLVLVRRRDASHRVLSLPTPARAATRSHVPAG